MVKTDEPLSISEYACINCDQVYREIATDKTPETNVFLGRCPRCGEINGADGKPRKEPVLNRRVP